MTLRRTATVLLLAGCVTAPHPVTPAPATVSNAPVRSEARVALEAFLQAVEQGDFARAHGLLSQSLRTRYDARRLERDYDADPTGKVRLARARQAIDALVVAGDEATLEWSPGRSLSLIAEPTGWKVATLE